VSLKAIGSKVNSDRTGKAASSKLLCNSHKASRLLDHPLNGKSKTNDQNASKFVQDNALSDIHSVYILLLLQIKLFLLTLYYLTCYQYRYKVSAFGGNLDSDIWLGPKMIGSWIATVSETPIIHPLQGLSLVVNILWTVPNFY